MEFKYIACDKAGKRIKATAQAEAADVLFSRLKNQGLTPLRILEVKPLRSRGLARKLSLRRGSVSGSELAVFARQMSSLLSSGILLIDALSTVSEDQENLYFKNLLNNIIAEINSGRRLSEALSRYPKSFPVTFVAVVRSGEEIGSLDKTLGSLAKYLEDFERTKKKIKSAMLYPVFLFGFLIFIVSMIMIFLIPKFKVIFASAKVRLPLLTRLVIRTSELSLQHALAAVIILLALWILLSYLLKSKKARAWLDSVLLELPVLGKILRKALIARFCHTLSILLTGGVRIASALSVSAQVVNNLFLRQIIEQVKNDIISGKSLEEAIKAYRVFPKIVVKMIAVGEKSGKLDEMLKRSAEYYDEELETTLNDFTTMLEPAFIILIGAVVLVVVVALYLPIFKMAMAVR